MSQPVATPTSVPVDRDEANRIWQHGLHEDTLFQHRLASFTLIESVLLGFFGNLYGKDGTAGFVWYVAILALCFSMIWLYIQYRHWVYLNHVTKRIQLFAPEFKATLSSFSDYWLWRFDTPLLLALAIPTLFFGIWTFLLCWMLLRPSDEIQSKFGISFDRFIIAILIAVVIWMFLRIRKIEKLLLTPTGGSPAHTTISSATPPVPGSAVVAGAAVAVPAATAPLTKSSASAPELHFESTAQSTNLDQPTPMEADSMATNG